MTVIDDPATWPLCDVLPLTRPVAGELWPELGLILADRPLTVFLLNAFEPGFWSRLGTAGRIDYPDAAAIAADGWRVD